MAMTEQQISISAEMWNSGASAGAISKKLGVSRNSVIGYASRYPGTYRPKMTQDAAGNRIMKAGFRKHEPRMKKADKPAAKVEQTLEVVIEEPTISPKEYDAARRPHALTLLELNACQCRWPLSEGPFRFCAEEVVPGKSWCEHHAKRARRQGSTLEAPNTRRKVVKSISRFV